MRDFYLRDREGNDILNLANLDPYNYSVGDMAITKIEYRRNSITFTWATEEEMESWKRWLESIDDDF